MVKRLLFILCLLPVLAFGQVPGTIQKTVATGTIRGNFGSSGLDSLISLQKNSLANLDMLRYNSATLKWIPRTPSQVLSDIGGGSGTLTGFTTIGSTPNANGGSVSGANIILQPASASFGGVVTTGAQTIAGLKTHTSAIRIDAGAPSLQLYRTNNTGASVIQYVTGGSEKWTLGQQSSGNENFTLINGDLASTALTVNATTNAATFIGALSASNLSLGSTFTTTPANALTLTTTGATNVTLPTSGTLATTTGIASSYVPYTGATTDVNLGAHSLTVDGTGADINIKAGNGLYLWNSGNTNWTAIYAASAAGYNATIPTLTASRFFAMDGQAASFTTLAGTSATFGTSSGSATNPGRVIIDNGGTNGPSVTNNGLEFVTATTGSGYGVKLFTNNSTDIFGIATRQNSATWVERFSISQITGAAVFNSTVRLKGYTVATLPAGTQGDIAFVTDALAPAFLATVVGGGAIVTQVFFNGANWQAQ